MDVAPFIFYCGNLGTGNLGIWESGNLGIWGHDSNLKRSKSARYVKRIVSPESQKLLAAWLSLLNVNEKIFRLTEASFRSGLESSLLVLTAQQSHTIAQQDMISARLTEALNSVTLYRVLGGGWK